MSVLSIVLIVHLRLYSRKLDLAHTGHAGSEKGCRTDREPFCSDAKYRDVELMRFCTMSQAVFYGPCIARAE